MSNNEVKPVEVVITLDWDSYSYNIDEPAELSTVFGGELSNLYLVINQVEDGPKIDLELKSTGIETREEMVEVLESLIEVMKQASPASDE